MRENRDYHLERAADRKAFRFAYGLLVAITLANLIVNSLSQSDELARRGAEVHALAPWIWEASSTIAWLGLIPLIYLVQKRFALDRDNWPIWLPVHVFASLAVSASHIAIMVTLRKLASPVLVDETYIFAGPDNLVSTLIYEYRKDALSYALIVFTFAMSRAFEASELELRVAREEARSNHRLTLKCGGKLIWLDIERVLWVQAASNYVEVHTEAKDYLARITLKGIESQLSDAGAPISRVHRSYLVNRNQVRELVPTGDGDARLLMADGSEVPASRTYRQNWPAA